MPFAHLGPCPTFTTGTPPRPGFEYAHEVPARCQIPYAFAMAVREVTVAEFRTFLADHPTPYHPPNGPEQRPDEPIVGVTWYQAAQFCRWLSDKEMVPEAQMCYPPVESIKPGIIFPRGFLRRTGYRLPTEREWEYAARAGSETTRAYGSAPFLPGQYAWYLGNSGDRPGRVATRRPNDFGLFDTLGNAWEWTHPVPRVPSPNPDVTDWLDDPAPTVSGVPSDYHPVARGGSYLYHSAYVRSAKRYSTQPNHVDWTIGFRIARTIGVSP